MVLYYTVTVNLFSLLIIGIHILVSVFVYLVGCLKVMNLVLAADFLYDFGTGLEVISPLCPHLFLEMAGLGNFAKVSKLLCNHGH